MKEADAVGLQLRRQSKDSPERTKPLPPERCGPTKTDFRTRSKRAEQVCTAGVWHVEVELLYVATACKCVEYEATIVAKTSAILSGTFAVKSYANVPHLILLIRHDEP